MDDRQSPNTSCLALCEMTHNLEEIVVFEADHLLFFFFLDPSLDILGIISLCEHPISLSPSEPKP